MYQNIELQKGRRRIVFGSAPAWLSCSFRFYCSCPAFENVIQEGIGVALLRVTGTAYTDAVRSAYTPHKDTDGCDEQWESLWKRIKGLEKEFGKSIPLSETEMKKQLDSVIALVSECIRLSAAVEYEQSEQAAALSLE